MACAVRIDSILSDGPWVCWMKLTGVFAIGIVPIAEEKNPLKLLAFIVSIDLVECVLIYDHREYSDIKILGACDPIVASFAKAYSIR